MSSFTTLHRVLVPAAQQDVVIAEGQYDQASTMISNAYTLMNSMAANHGTTNTDVNAGAAANPSNDAWQRLKDVKDEALSDKVATQAKAEAIKAAFQAVVDHGAAAVLAAVEGIA